MKTGFVEHYYISWVSYQDVIK